MSHVIDRMLHLMKWGCTGASVVLASMSAVTLAAQSATTYPAKPIKIIVPWPAGGPSDIVGRVFAEPLAKVLGQPIVVENRGGASGAIGAELVARANPDGYTLMVQSMTNQAMFPLTIKNLRFDPMPILSRSRT